MRNFHAKCGNLGRSAAGIRNEGNLSEFHDSQDDFHLDVLLLNEQFDQMRLAADFPSIVRHFHFTFV